MCISRTGGGEPRGHLTESQIPTVCNDLHHIAEILQTPGISLAPCSSPDAARPLMVQIAALSLRPHLMDELAWRPGMYGLLHCNSLVLMNLVQLGENPKEPDLDLRRFDPSHLGLLCCGWTPHSLEAGSARYLCKGVRIRVPSPLMCYCLHRFGDILAHSDLEGDPVVRCCNWYMTCTPASVALVVLLARTFSASTHHAPTVHQCGNGIRICVAPGVLVRWTGTEWVDSVCGLGLPIPAGCEFCPILNNVPFLHLDRPPRILLGANHCVQAVCMPHIKPGSTITPCNQSVPLVATARVESQLGENGPPGEDCVVAYYNCKDTYEDCIVVSSGCADRGLFCRLTRSSYPLSHEAAEKLRVWNRTWPRSPSEVRTSTHPWWKPDSVGTVVGKRLSPDGTCKIVTVEHFSQLKDGDKLGTHHGQKGVVKLRCPEDMPILHDYDGREVVPDMLVSTSSMTKRGTAGQAAEGFVGCEVCETGRLACRSSTDRFVGRIRRARVTCPFSGSPETDDSGAQVVCTWGITRVMLLYHITDDKLHYTHSAQMGPSRAGGNGVKFSEMEHDMALGTGMPHCASELRDRQNMHLIEVCSRCDSLAQSCICEEPGTCWTMKAPAVLGALDAMSVVSCGIKLNIR